MVTEGGSEELRSRAHVRDEPWVGGVRLYLLEWGGEGGRESSISARRPFNLAVEKELFPIYFLDKLYSKVSPDVGMENVGKGKEMW